MGTEGESQGVSRSDDATGPNWRRPGHAGLCGHLGGGTPVHKVNVLLSDPPANGHQPQAGILPASAMQPGALPADTAPLPHPDGAGVSGAAHGVSSGGTLLAGCFTQVLKINLTLISPTGEKLIEVLFLIYEEP